MKKRFKIIILAIIILIALGLISIGCNGGCSFYKSKNDTNTTSNNSSIPKVEVLRVADAKNNGLYKTYKGVVEPQAEVNVVSLVAGQIIEFLADVGDDVKEGSILVRLDSPELFKSLTAAKTAYANAKQNLAQVRLVTENQVQQAELSIINTKLGLALAKDSYLNTQVSTDQDITAAEKSIEASNSALDQVNKEIATLEEQIMQSENSYTNQANIIQKTQAVFLDNIAKEVEYLLKNVIEFGFFSAENQQLRIDAEDTARDILIKINKYQNSPHNITSNITIQELKLLKAIFLETHSTLSLIISGLNATNASNGLSPTSLTLLETTFNSLEAQTSATIQTVDGLIATIDATNLQNVSSRNQLATQKRQAEIALQNSQSALTSLKASLNTVLLQSRTGAIQAENALKTAEQGLEQAKVSQNIQILSANSALSAARTQLDLTQIRIDNTIIKSPLAGVITRRNAQLGQEIVPNTSLFEIKNTDTLKIVVEVSEGDLAEIFVGDEAVIKDNLKGIVYSIEPELSNTSKQGIVKILYNDSNSQLILGSLVDVGLPISSTDTSLIFIPLNSAALADNGAFVKVVENSKIASRQVVLGDVRGEYVEVKSGLLDNDMVVVAGGSFLKDGAEVEIKSKY